MGDAAVEKYCTCPDVTGDACGGVDLCIKGYLTASACTPPYSTWIQEIHGLCSRCEADTTTTTTTTGVATTTAKTTMTTTMPLSTTVTASVTTATTSGAISTPTSSTGAVLLSSAYRSTLFPCLFLLVATHVVVPFLSS